MARANDVRRHSPSTRRQHNLSVKVARIFNTYGPRMHPNDGRVVSNFIVQALKNQPITIFGEGQQTRSLFDWMTKSHCTHRLCGRISSNE